MFLIHIALEAPLVVQTFFTPASLPFIQMTNTTVVLLKVRRSLRFHDARSPPLVVRRHRRRDMYRLRARLSSPRYVLRYRGHTDIMHMDADVGDASCQISEFLPGKRAFAIALCVYHSVASTILFQAPRFIPHTFGVLSESWVSPFCSLSLWRESSGS